MTPTLVVISHYNAWPTDHLFKLLDEIHAVPAGHPFRCRVVVNQAEDKRLDLPSRYADVEVLYRENLGYNIGLGITAGGIPRRLMSSCSSRTNAGSSAQAGSWPITSYLHDRTSAWSART